MKNSRNIVVGLPVQRFTHDIMFFESRRRGWTSQESKSFKGAQFKYAWPWTSFFCIVCVQQVRPKSYGT